MLTNDNIDKVLKDNYETICENLNINGTNVAKTSWEVYQSVKNDHNLEVSRMVAYAHPIHKGPCTMLVHCSRQSAGEIVIPND